MKATGIVRRIDDLGRVVIPKEIRRTLHIREGDPLEIYVTGEGEVVFRKHSPLLQLSHQAEACAAAVYRAAGLSCLVADRDHIIASAGLPRREVSELPLPNAALQAMEQRTSYTGEEQMPGVGDCSVVACPILSAGDVLGCVLTVVPGGGTEGSAQALTLAAAGFLGAESEL